ncbi:alpha-glucuronidase family glycosyl hydrolase [Sphingobacterium tabacisoli]|uniref:Alpha-glucuronidase family glycosyl hydrolase n=1 Tax=Sphingobacterium tabacisoli TaxID=2044855 RepID=A0ABW5L3H9_9SPHI|nr:alpha-glucuronidase family glycosyl hydrolase [Sphingobacterium tabacisoli]
MKNWRKIVVLFLGILGTIVRSHGQEPSYTGIDIVVLDNQDALIQQSATVLSEEIAKRSTVAIRMVSKPESFKKGVLTIFVGTEKSAKARVEGSNHELDALPKIGKDGFKVKKNDKRNTLLIIGHDSRGCLYGVGHVLRKIQMKDKNVDLALLKAISSTPSKTIRSQGLHIHKKGVNEPWGIAYFEQYVRDLALFGMNVVQLSTDITASQIAASKKYGMEVWLYDPCDNNNKANGYYTTEEGLKLQLERRRERLGKLPHVDAIFVPGGDPGTLKPAEYFGYLDVLKGLLNEIQPKAKIWVSMQSFHMTQEWVDTFVHKTNERKEWLGGFIFAPWGKVPMFEMRSYLHPSVQMVTLPDICHPMNSQYPVLNLDMAFAMTYGRSSINPLPAMQKHIHNLYSDLNAGSITYSEANYDDLNKFIWSDQEWDASTDVRVTLQDYARLFLGIQDVDLFVRGVEGLEKNFDGPLITNSSTISQTLKLWQDLEKTVGKGTLDNPRFQMLLFKAYYDMYQSVRLVYETESEALALDELTKNKALGIETVISNAKRFLHRRNVDELFNSYKNKCHQIYSANAKTGTLNIGDNYRWLMEIQPMSSSRNIDFPLNNKEWLLDQFSKIESMSSEIEQREALGKIVNRTSVGSQEYYDNLGSPESLMRIQGLENWATDPGTLKTPRVYFGSTEAKIPLAQRRQISGLYDTPVTVRYDNLDKGSSYIIRIAYGGVFKNQKIQLVVDGHTLHDYQVPDKSRIYEFEIPKKLTLDGGINLTWKAEEGQTISQIAEVWILKKKDTVL